MGGCIFVSSGPVRITDERTPTAMERVRVQRETDTYLSGSFCYPCWQLEDKLNPKDPVNPQKKERYRLPSSKSHQEVNAHSLTHSLTLFTARHRTKIIDFRHLTERVPDNY